MSFPCYGKYKDSGVDWLMQVPEHWSVSRLGFECETVVPMRDKPGDLDGEIPWIRIEDFDGKFISTSRSGQGVSPETVKKMGLKVLPIGTVLCSCSCSMGATAIVSAPLVTNQTFIGIIPGERYSPDYLYFLFQAASEHLNTIGTGAIQTYLSRDDFRRLRIPHPPLPEQVLLATFLDRETAKIDALIVEQESLIEILQEKRHALISRAVTKGLNPNVPMQDSGVQWLGEVPAHWQLGRIKNYFQTCSGGTPNTSQQDLYYSDEAGGFPWVRTTDLKNDILRGVEVFITALALKDTACSILPAGTVMVAMYGGDGTVGKNGLLAIPAAINQAVCGLLPNSTHIPEYALRFLQFYRPYWMIAAESSRKDPNISQDRVRNAPFLFPPREEQEAIVKFLNERLQQMDELIGEAQRAIDLLRERRLSLITAAVTGKIDASALSETVAA